MVGDNIKKYREMLKYSQAYVAEELGISQNAYSKIENNQTKSFTLERLEKIAALFHINLGDLLGEEKAINVMHNHIGYGYVNQNQESSELVALLKEEIMSLREDKDRLLKIIERLTKEEDTE